jgi:MFS transporter, ACS family, hexuronate transporter
LTGRKIVLVGCLLLGGLCVALVPVVHSTQGAVAMMSLAVGFIYLSGPNYYAIVNELVSKTNIGSAIGLVVVCATCAGIVSPIVSGYLIKTSSNYSSSFAVAGIISAVGAIVFGGLARRRPN